jgi:hypothetical protein
MTTDPANLWTFLPLGYALSLVLETPVLLVGLSPRHSIRRRLFAGAWLTACTYPIVILVLPQLVWRPLGEQAGYWPYVAVSRVCAVLVGILEARARTRPRAKAGSKSQGFAPRHARDHRRQPHLVHRWLVDIPLAGRMKS